MSLGGPGSPASGVPGPTPPPPPPAPPAPPPPVPAPAPPPFSAPAEAGESLSLSRPGWPPAATDVGDDWPAYGALFGQAAYVRDPGDRRLVDLVSAALAAEPSLRRPPLGPAVAAGRIDAEAVKALQGLLAARGGDLGPAGIDGKFGPKTHAALIALLEGAPAGPESVDRPAPGPGPERPPHEPGPGPVVPPPPAPPPLRPAPTPGPPPAPPRPLDAADPLAALPPRAPDATGGRAFLARTAGLSRAQREEAILQEVLAGNVPDFLRQMPEIEVRLRTADGREVVGRVKVLPDYLAIGANEDHVRIPMSPLTAQRIADALGCALPTRKLVDDVYRQAGTRLTPKPLPAGPQMMSNDYYRRHADAVDAQLPGGWPGGIVAGHKKDVVVSAQLATHPGRVAIYGWHQPNGKPIQGLSTVHEETYADYSHGVRLIAGIMTVDGRPMSVAEVLADPELSRLLSDEGPIRQPRYRA